MTPSRKLASGATALLIALLMLPNFIWLGYSHAPTTWIEAMVLPPVLLAALFALLGRWLWLSCLLLAPFALLSPLETFYIWTYHTPSAAQVIAVARVSNVQEILAYAGPSLPLAIAAPLSGLGIALMASWWCFREKLRWTGRIPVSIIVIVIATPLLSLGIGFTMAKGSAAESLHVASYPLRGIVDSLQPGYPFGVLQRFSEFQHEWTAMRANAAKFRDFTYYAHRSGTQPHERQVYVLVIGESSARDHWQLFGYERPTNPQLSQITNLVPITRMVTSWPETLAAVPIMLTRKPITSNNPKWDEPSFLPAMKEAGYETWWISNQYPIGKFDSPVATYAYEAQHVEWVNRTVNWNNPGAYDGALIPSLRRALQNSNSDMFIVLHMMGSHMRYDSRYPPAFAQFRPTESEVKNATDRYAKIRNSYDNSILYTDHVLAEIINTLKQSGTVSALWYESDHGEVLPSPGCNKQGHGIGTIHEFEIPALFWYSDAYAKDFPQRVIDLRANAGRRTVSGNTFASMLDMTGVDFPNLDHTWSLFSSKWRYHKRMVAQFWYSDFDHSAIGSGCGVVMPASAASAVH